MTKAVYEIDLDKPARGLDLAEALKKLGGHSDGFDRFSSRDAGRSPVRRLTIRSGARRLPIESVFTEVVMQHMADIGMTFEPQVCPLRSKIGNAIFA